jgi:hypothetical protein
MELKTLKDILSPDNDWDETSEAKCGEAVRQEAIKWIKYIREKAEKEMKDFGMNPLVCNSSSKFAVDFIKHFFNLTDEEIDNG